MADREVLRRAVANRERVKALERCKRDSWYLATEILGYGWNEKARKGLTRRLHYPLCRWYDRYRDDPFLGLWMARTRHKTTLVIVWHIQALLRDPCKTHRYWHAVDDLAAETLIEIVGHLRHNTKLRALDPVGVDESGRPYKIFPRGNASRWFKVGKGDASYTINRHKKYGAGTRGPTLRAQGAGSEATGAHIDGEAWLDDIISRKTVENSELQKIQRWYQNTVTPVVDSKLIRCTGTPWSEQSVHQLWMASPHWRTIIIPGAITEPDDEMRAKIMSEEQKIHFTPDYKLGNPVFGPVEFLPKARKMMKVEQREMKGDFAPQIMCDPEPESEKAWSKACEHFTGIKKTEDAPGIEGPGVVVVISDPAPFLQGGYKGLGEKQRGDGTKDWWSIQVWKLRRREQILDAIFLDGVHSQEWGHAQGADEVCRLMKKWRTNKYVSEQPDEHFPFMKEAAIRNNCSIIRAKDGGPLKFKEYNRADGKNQRFIALAEKAKLGEVWISETVPDSMLFGDGTHTGFLTQARKHRKVGPGKTSLRFDDDIDCAGRVMDKVLLDFAPTREITPEFPWWQRDDEPEFVWGTRHVRA